MVVDWQTVGVGKRSAWLLARYARQKPTTLPNSVGLWFASAQIAQYLRYRTLQSCATLR
jgi:hypothetical protein